MSKAVLLSCLLAMTLPAAADAPPATGLDRLAQVLPGTWKTEGQTLDTQFTKAGPQRYTTVRDCWRDGDSYKCVFVVNGTLQLYDIISWRPVDGVYLQTRITAQGRQPEFRISVKDSVWTFAQDIQQQDGHTVHYRIVRTYTSPVSAGYVYEYSNDGKDWTRMAEGTETRIDAGR